MPASLDQLESDAMLLNQHDRAELVERLVASLASQTDNQVQQAWLQVALRHRDAIRSGQVDVISGPEGLAMGRSPQ